MALVYLGLGTNLGNKYQNLNDSLIQISMNVGDVVCVSTYYASKAVGFISENSFLNAVALIETYLTPFQLLKATQLIEKEMGRSSKTTLLYEDRIIDIDILLYDNLIINQPKLKIPHPLMLERDFVIIPLNEIAPDIIHPISGKKVTL